MQKLPKALLICTFAVGVILFSFPKLVTGDYADITIKDVSFKPNGDCLLEFTHVSSCGTPVSEEFYQDTRLLIRGGGQGGRFPRRPSPGGGAVFLMLNPEKIQLGSTPPPSVLTQRLLVHSGQRLRLHSGQKLMLYDFRAADGSRHHGFIQVHPSSSQI